MKVLHLVHQYPPDFMGGVEGYTLSLTQELVRRGWKIGVFHRAYRPGSDLVSGVRDGVAIFAAADGPLAPTQRFLATWRQPALLAHWRRTLDQFTPDLVHVQHLMGLPAALLDELQSRRIPYLVTLHDYWWQCANANLLTNYAETRCDGPRAFLNCTRCAVARSASPAAWGAAPLLWGLLADRNRRLHPLLERAAALLTPSEFVRRWYADHGAPAHHLQAVRLGVTPPAAPIVRQERPRTALKLLYLGGLAPNKGVHVVLEALQGVSGAVRLAIAGDESTHPIYAARLRDLADDRVAFLGRLARTQVWQALADADILVAPSLWHETFCFVVHEALAAGTPVLASAMGALTDAIQEDATGRLLPPGDVTAWRGAIQALVDDPARIDAWRARITPPLLLAGHVDKIESIYREILAGAP